MTFSVTAFIQNVHQKQLYRNSEQISCCLRESNMMEFFVVLENVLILGLDCGVGPTNLYIFKKQTKKSLNCVITIGKVYSI